MYQDFSYKKVKTVSTITQKKNLFLLQKQKF